MTLRKLRLVKTDVTRRWKGRRPTPEEMAAAIAPYPDLLRGGNEAFVRKGKQRARMLAWGASRGLRK